MAPKRPRRRPAVHIVTLGCPKNEVDSDRMTASLSEAFDVVEDPDDADVVVVNTCAFIREATEESIGVVLEFAEWKRAAEGRALVVAGCMPSRYGEDLAAELPEVDAFVPVSAEAGITSALARVCGVPLGSPQAAPDAAGKGRRAPAKVPGPVMRTAQKPSAYLQISDGCHRRCSFCTIPAIRGDYRSRTAADLIEETRVLVAGGAKEIVLVGQDVSAWGRDLPGKPSLAELVRKLVRLHGVEWLRLMYVQPDGVTPELLETMADEPKVCRYLDLPLQHASRDVLSRMGRQGDAAEFLRLISTIRSLVPGVFLRTTLIAGFPGETRHDSEVLQRFVRDAAFDYVGVFAYSPEEGTRAAALPDQVPLRTRRVRAQRLRDLGDEIGVARASRLVGRPFTVLVEGVDEEGVTVARHRGQGPEVDGIVLIDRPLRPGTLTSVQITDTLGYDLLGEVM
ncbi:MAG TPA: 30S ribosomal protein S12 methylthiotransferase RimO [Coriobacteriia bacterium]